MFLREAVILILKGDQFHTTSFNCCFCCPSSRKNCFLKNLPFQLEQKSDSARSCCLKILYKLCISSIEQSGYHVALTSGETYRMKNLSGTINKYVWRAHFYLSTFIYRFNYRPSACFFLTIVLSLQRSCIKNKFPNKEK